MKRKNILLHIIYFAVFLLLFLAEKNTGIKAFALAFLMSLVYCRQNVLIICPLFAASSMILTPELINLLFALLPCAIIILAYFIHYKAKRKITPLYLSVYAFLSQIPMIALYTYDVYQMTNTIISVLGTQLFMYNCLAFLNPLFTRGLRYRLRHEEKLALFVFCAVIFLALSFLRVWGFSVFAMVAVFTILLTKQSLYSLTLIMAGAMGLGSGIALQNFYYLALLVTLALIAMAFRDMNIYITAVAVVIGTVAFTYFFNRSFEALEIASYASGALLAVLMPKRLFIAVKSLQTQTASNMSAKTLANRNRKEVAKRLFNLSGVFYEIQDILKYELNDKKNRYDEKIITAEVCRKCCRNCPFAEDCKQKMGDTSFAVSGMALAAMDNGKATLLDTPPVLVNQCKRVNTLINTVNDTVSRYKKRRLIEQSIEQGREMIIAQMGGVGLLLEKLGEEMRAEICYDTVLEKRIYETLCAEGTPISDIVVYGKDGEIDKITLTVKESDADNKAIGEVLSSFMGMKMIENKREKNIKGNMVLHFIASPKLDVVYGDMAVAKDENDKCGDNRKAVRISEDKIMLILSDGMGSGQQAYNSSMNAIRMIESFYKAGFDHTTVLSCVGRLLGLREKEDFNALDIAVVDVRKGAVDFIKQGGRESFILSNGSVEVINCGSLPLGIVEDSFPIIEQKQLYDGDIIVLVSDGVIDSLGTDMIRDILLTSNTVNPQIFAELLVNNAKRLAQEKGIRDDMSCIAGRVIEYKRVG